MQYSMMRAAASASRSPLKCVIKCKSPCQASKGTHDHATDAPGRRQAGAAFPCTRALILMVRSVLAAPWAAVCLAAWAAVRAEVGAAISDAVCAAAGPTAVPLGALIQAAAALALRAALAAAVCAAV